MLKNTSKEFKTFFLLQFTKELIRASSPQEIFELKELIKEQKQLEPKEILKEKIKEHLSSQKKELPKIPSLNELISQKKEKNFFNQINKPVQIPEIILPPSLRDIKPFPSQVPIDLKKLNPLMLDSSVSLIECPGENQKIIVSGKMGRKPTPIILSKEEIKEVVETFSKKAKIPLQEGVFRVAVGKFILSTIISEMISLRFIIKKMPVFQQTNSRNF